MAALLCNPDAAERGNTADSRKTDRRADGDPGFLLQKPGMRKPPETWGVGRHLDETCLHEAWAAEPHRGAAFNLIRP